VTLLDRTLSDLALVIEYWPGLADTRLPDVRRPHREPTITPEARAELDHQARIERAERIDIAPGEHIDAVRPEVLDMMGDLLWISDDVAAVVASAIYCPQLPPPTTAFADPSPLLAWTAANLPLGHQADPDLVQYVAGKTGDMVAMLTMALSLSYDGQRLQVLCPWCKGAILGERTLRVRVLPGDMVAIVCEFPLCSPELNEVKTWWKGRPVWDLEMWPWLAKRIAKASVEPEKVRISYQIPYPAEPSPSVLNGLVRDDTADLA
jgi:hypothetical protein